MTFADPRTWLAIGAAFLLLLGLLAHLRRLRAGNLVRERSARGRAGEDAAEAFLRRRFAEVERHPRLESALWIEGEEHRYELRPDFLVRAGRQRMLVEVKSGEDRDPRQGETRRQILEYALASECERIGLFDARSGRLQELRFDLLERRAPSAGPWLFALAVALGAGFALGWICRG